MSVDDQVQLWADAYDRELTEVFSIQRDVAERIAGSLSVELLPSERASLSARTESAKAYEAYLRRLYAMRPFTIDSMLEATERFEQALAFDAELALTQAMRSRAYWNLGQPLLGYPYRDAMEIAKAAAIDALTLDENEAVAHSALAWVQASYDWDWSAADVSYRRALQLNPSAANARLVYAFLLAATRHHARALEEGNRALDNAPLDIGFHRTELAWVLGGVGDSDAAFDALEEAYTMHAGDLILLRVAPWFDPLRGDPRFADLVARMRFP